MPPEIPQIFVHWERFLNWLFAHTADFPARLRHSLTLRIENRALDVHEALVEARFRPDRAPTLVRVNLDIDRLRLLLRLAHDQRVLDHRAFAHACAELDTAGRMVGGWSRRATETRS